MNWYYVGLGVLVFSLALVALVKWAGSSLRSYEEGRKVGHGRDPF